MDRGLPEQPDGWDVRRQHGDHQRVGSFLLAEQSHCVGELPGEADRTIALAAQDAGRPVVLGEKVDRVRDWGDDRR